MATRAAAPPPTALKSETSCGIAVMATRSASSRPTAPPMRKPPTMMMSASVERPPSRSSRATKVTTTASVMPAAEMRLPVRAVAGLPMKCRPTTKPAAARTPTRMTIVSSVSCDIA